jgi:hypothetical protein
MCRFDTDFHQISNLLIQLELLEALTIPAPHLGEKRFRDSEIRFPFLALAFLESEDRDACGVGRESR